MSSAHAAWNSSCQRATAPSQKRLPSATPWSMRRRVILSLSFAFTMSVALIWMRSASSSAPAAPGFLAAPFAAAFLALRGTTVSAEAGRGRKTEETHRSNTERVKGAEAQSVSACKAAYGGLGPPLLPGGGGGAEEVALQSGECTYGSSVRTPSSS